MSSWFLNGVMKESENDDENEKMRYFNDRRKRELHFLLYVEVLVLREGIERGSECNNKFCGSMIKKGSESECR